MPGTQGQLCQERTVSQPTDIVPRKSFRLSPNEGCTGHTAARGVLLIQEPLARQIEPGCRYAVTEQRLLRRVDNSHCLTYYSKDMDVLAHDWPNLLLYAFPPITLIPHVIRRIREQKHKVILVAPLWRNQHWFSELSQLLTAAPWPIPLRRDLLSQANRTMWHPRPELWALHLWPLGGCSQTSPRAFKTESFRLEPHLQDTSMPLNGLFLPPGAHPWHRPSFL